MSVRENSASHLVSTLQSATSPLTPKLVTREPFDFTELSNAQFPALLIQTANEDRRDVTLGDNLITREGVITYQIFGYVKSTTIDTARNQLIETVEEALDADRTRGGNALDSQIVSIETDEGAIAPIGGIIVTVEVMYNFVRGNT